jgi:hypothetical protein
MARHDALPVETWISIFARLEMEDRMSVVATCQYFRAFRAFAWAQITLTMHLIRTLANKLARLGAALEADASLQPLIRGMCLRGLKFRGPESEHWNDDNPSVELDVAVAGVLHLAPRVECFVFEAPESDSDTYDQTLQALCKLPALKTLALGNLHQDVMNPDRYCLESRVLERLIVACKGVMDHFDYIGEQKLLKSVELPIRSGWPLDVATSWVALEELSIPDEPGLWPSIVSRGLVII